MASRKKAHKEISVEHIATDVLCMAVWQTGNIHLSDVQAFLNTLPGFEESRLTARDETAPSQLPMRDETGRTLAFYYIDLPPDASSVNNIFNRLFQVFQLQMIRPLENTDTRGNIGSGISFEESLGMSVGVYDTHTETSYTDTAEFAGSSEFADTAISAGPGNTIEHPEEELIKIPTEDKIPLFPSSYETLTGGLIELVGITPNWNFGGAQGHFGGGGPGSDPVPVPPENEPHPTDPQPFAFNTSRVDRYFSSHNTAETERLVDVFILDTAWSKAHIQQMAIEDFPNNQLLKQLAFSPNFQVHLASEVGIDLPSADHKKGWALAKYTKQNKREHFYVMRDHGLFITGTIYQLAPCAKIHLIQVLNKWGVGTLRGLLDALSYIPKLIRPEASVIVNCSFVISFTSLSEMLTELLGQRATTEKIYNAFADWLMGPLETSVQLAGLEKTNTKILAAAGNDGKVSGARPPARYPAYHREVIGVGALTSEGIQETYSNEADYPISVGLWVFGGDADWFTDPPPPPGSTTPANLQSERGKHITNKGKGMVGLYIADDFPDGSPNWNGLAYWAGTSFATGLASGIFAKLLCERNVTPTDIENIFKSNPDKKLLLTRKQWRNGNLTAHNPE